MEHKEESAKGTPNIIFMCIGNSCRSQMAEGFMKVLAPKEWKVSSAGTKPADRVNPLAIEVMKEVGIDISSHYSKIVTSEMIGNATHLISMGCGVFDSCPVFIYKDKVLDDWGIEDLVNQPIEKFREVRDLIKQKVEYLIQKINNH